MKKLFLFATIYFVQIYFARAQSYNIILGRPSDSSITISILFDQSVEVYWEYGTQSGSYSHITPTYNLIAGIPLEVDFNNLATNTKYFYRTRYRNTGSSSSFLTVPEHEFTTRRSKGSTFSFVIEADPHLDVNTDSLAYLVTLRHMLSKKPDFLIDLGDNFMIDKMPVINQTEITNRNLLFRRFYGELCHSSPLYLVLGNHEGEYGWVTNNTTTSMPVMSTNTRKLYYPNPFPNTFYSGNSVTESLVGLRENYYSWEWGDALFIVLDPYWHTTTKSVWGWTLGKTQYDWLKQVISSSTAKYKFVFCHQLVSGNGIEGRGGVESVPLYEMGGNNVDASYGFDISRPGWGKPIHTILKENGATIFFHGHDHLFAKQDKDNIVYQEVPQPSARNITNITGTEPGYGYTNGLLLPNRGYLHVTVNADSVKVDYVRTYLSREESATSQNGNIAYTYTIKKPSGNNVINNQELVKVYPNPSKDNLQIDFLSPPGRYTIQILNASGQTVMRPSATYIPTNTLPNGAYFIFIEAENYQVSKKIIIQH